MWQLTQVGLAEAEEFRIFETEAMSPIKALVDLNGGEPEAVRDWVQANHDIVNFGHLQEANSYAWRSDEVAMATVLDHRFGQMRDQIHVWQATIDAEAFIFTTHPRTGVPEGDDLTGDDKPGYWTGEASVPRSAQHERTGIHIYRPSWDETTSPLLWSLFGYQDETHVRAPGPLRRGGPGRQLDLRPQGNRLPGPVVVAHAGLAHLRPRREPDGRHDRSLRPGGRGRRRQRVDRRGGRLDRGGLVRGVHGRRHRVEPAVERDDDGFAVAWTSPSSGEVTFGSTAPFTVGGTEQQLDELPRHESRWGTVDRLATTFELASDAATLTLDFDANTRAVDRR